MAQITWQNINSDMSAYQGRALEGAGRSFDSMFEKLQGVVARTQAVDDKNWENTKMNRTNDALNQIMGYGSPEAMAEAQKAGALEQLLGGGQIDQQAVRSAFDARMPELQRRGKQGIDYKNTMIDDATAPLMEAARMLAIQGKPQEAQAMLAQYAAQGGRNGSQGAEYVDGRQQLGVTRGRDDKRFLWDGEDQVNQNAAAKDDLLTGVVRRDQLRNSMANDNASRSLAQAKFNYDKDKENRDYKPGGAGFSAAIEKQYEVEKSNSVMSMGAYGTKEGMANLAKELTARGIKPGERDDLLFNLSKYYKKGVPLTHEKDGKPKDRLALPVTAILEALDTSTENPLSFITPGWSRKGDDTVNKLDKRFGINSEGEIDTDTFTDRDQDMINEMIKMNGLDVARTAGLNRPTQNLEIGNTPKGKGKKSK